MTNKKREYIFLGAPASGKGTQTSILAKNTSLPHVDTGSLLRTEIAQGTPEGMLAKVAIDDGRLVPINVVADIIKKKLASDDCKDGFILDGYPRSIEQADMLEEILKEIDVNVTEKDFSVIYFNIDESKLLERIVTRRSCSQCGEIYNIKFKPSKVEGVCDFCGGSLSQRMDDTEEVAHKRFTTFYSQTAPLIDYYKQRNVLKNLDANGTVEEIYRKLEGLLNL